MIMGDTFVKEEFTEAVNQLVSTINSVVLIIYSILKSFSSLSNGVFGQTMVNSALSMNSS